MNIYLLKWGNKRKAVVVAKDVDEAKKYGHKRFGVEEEYFGVEFIGYAASKFLCRPVVLASNDPK